MLVFGHRGGKAYGPENTVSTIEKAVSMGAHGVEVDIRCSMDDKPVLMHDATVDRTTNGSGDVFKMNLDVLEKLDAGEGKRVPGLAKALELLQPTKCMFLLELKHPATALPTAKIVDHFQKEGKYSQGRIVIISFYHQLIALIHDEYPKILTGALVKTIPESLAACGEYTGAHYILPPIDELNDEFMADAKKRDLNVVPYVCETQEQINKAKLYNVHGLITPAPDMALKK